MYVCMYVSIFMHVCVYSEYICVFTVSIRVYVNAGMCICELLCECMMYVFVVSVHVCTVSVCVYEWRCVCLCTYVSVCM